MTLAQGSSPQSTEFYYSEGLTYIGNGKLVRQLGIPAVRLPKLSRGLHCRLSGLESNFTVLTIAKWLCRGSATAA